MNVPASSERVGPTRRHRWPYLVAGGLLAVLLSSSGCAWLDVRQRELIYRPTPGQADPVVLRAGDERYFAELPPTASRIGATGEASDERGPAAQQVELWWLPHADPQAPTLLYFHGTVHNLAQNLPKMEALRAAGFAVLAVDYRGWGLSTPITPSERSILQDAELAWAELARREPRADRRVLYGHSMGSGVAVDLASRLRGPADYAALILESAFTSFEGVAGEAGWLARWLASLQPERFASIDKIRQVRAPLLMLHGSADDTIPLHLGLQLFEAAPQPKAWVPLAGGGHSDLHQVAPAQYQAALRRFTAQYLAQP